MDAEKYLKHSAGIYSLFNWLQIQEKLGMAYVIEHNKIQLNHLSSRYFSLGILKNKKKSTFPFLAAQPEESEWIRFLSWDNVTIKKNDLNFYLVSQTVQGGDDYPDLNAFVIALPFDHFSKIELLNNYDQIEAREYYLDETNNIQINTHKPLFKLPLVFKQENEKIIDDTENKHLNNYEDIIKRKIQKTNIDFEPDYQGEKYDSPLHKRLKDLLK